MPLTSEGSTQAARRPRVLIRGDRRLSYHWQRRRQLLSSLLLWRLLLGCRGKTGLNLRSCNCALSWAHRRAGDAAVTPVPREAPPTPTPRTTGKGATEIDLRVLNMAVVKRNLFQAVWLQPCISWYVSFHVLRLKFVNEIPSQ